MSTLRVIPTRHGDAHVVGDRSRHPIAALLLNHGAGGGIDAPDLEALAKALPRHGISVMRLVQPWKVAGKRVASRPEVLDECLVAVVNKIRVRSPLVIGGRSAGARAAARCARDLGATGVLALAFPLHPPGRPERSRLDELDGAGLSTLVIQGERDPFGRPEEFPPRDNLTVVPGADHGFKVPKRGDITQEEGLAIIVEATLEWIVRDVVGNRTRI